MTRFQIAGDGTKVAELALAANTNAIGLSGMTFLRGFVAVPGSANSLASAAQKSSGRMNALPFAVPER